MTVQWNFSLDFQSSCRKGAAEDQRRFSTNPYQEMYGALDTRWNTFERRAFNACQHAVAGLLRCLDIPDIPVLRDRIHILSAREYQGKVYEPALDDAGKHAYGHVYVQRRKNRARFLNDLAHEISHQVAYYRLAVRRSRDDSGEVHCKMSTAQSGVIQFANDTTVACYLGYGEAVTEIFAKAIRAVIYTGDHHFTARELAEVMYLTAYGETVQLVMDLLDGCVAKRRTRASLYNQLFRDHLAGTYSILLVIDNRFPGASRMLRTLGTSPEEAVSAKKKLLG